MMAAKQSRDWRLTSFVAELDPLSDTQSVIPVEDFIIGEAQGSWRGYATVDPGPGQPLSVKDALETALAYGILPGTRVALGLVISSPGAEGILARTWPSMITKVGTAPMGKDGPHDAVCRVHFCDPVTYLWRRSIWGAYRDCSPGNMFGGALSLAVGGDGAPTLEPVAPNMPVMHIQMMVRDALSNVPYAIATGEPFGHWLNTVLGRLGVRIQLMGKSDGEIDIILTDMSPSGTPVQMTLDESPYPSAENALVTNLTVGSPTKVRGSILDNQFSGSSIRLGEPGAVESLFYGAELGLEEAELRANFERERGDIELTRLKVRTAQPGLYPSRLLEFTNRTALGADTWQVNSVWHAYATNAYNGVAELAKAGVAWRPRVLPDEGPVIVSGIVDDGQSEMGESISRDRMGRIPVTFCFLPAPIEDEPEKVMESEPAGESGSPPESSPSSDQEPPVLQPTSEPAVGKMSGVVPGVRVMLPVIEPMAGGMHGVVPGHRQGDVCRVSVQNPLYAEILGFVHNDSLRVGVDVTNASAGMIVRHGSGKWSGVLFRPEEEAESDRSEA